MITSYILGLDFSYHVSYSRCQMVPFIFSSFSHQAHVPRRVHSSEGGSPSMLLLISCTSGLLLCSTPTWLLQWPLKNIRVCQRAQVQENTMALFEKCWLFNEKHCCLPGEVAFTTAWVAPTQRAALAVAGSLLGSSAGHRGGPLLWPCPRCDSGMEQCSCELQGTRTAHPATSFHVIKISEAQAACTVGLAWQLATFKSL